MQVGTLLLLAGAQTIAVKKLAPRYASDVLIGGILAGVTRFAKIVLPGRFTTCGLGEDLEGLSDDMYGMGDWMASPGNIRNAFALRGMDAYPSPQAPVIGTAGMDDYALRWQAQPQNIVQLDGLADSEVQREIAMQM